MYSTQICICLFLGLALETRASKLSLHLLSPLDGVDRTADLPMLFFLDPYEAVHNLPSCNDKDIYVSCTKISINIDLLRDKSVFQILLPDGTVLDRSENHDAGEIGDGMSNVHFGNEDHSASAYFSFPTVTGDGAPGDTRITGDIHMPHGVDFAVESGVGFEVLAEYNLKAIEISGDDAMGEEAPRNDERNLDEKYLLAQDRVLDETTLVNVSVAIWFTDDFAERENDIQGYVNTLFQQANAGMTNSRVPIKFIHHGTKRYTGPEFMNGGQMMGAFREGGDEILNTADMAYLLVARSNVGGMGFYDSTRLPFAFGTHGASRGIYAFAHELGHVMGLHHNVENMPNPSSLHYPSGMGMLFARGEEEVDGKRTIMAGSWPYFRQVVNYYSSPDDYVSGVPTGVLGEANNRQILLENRFRTAAVGDESSIITPVDAGFGAWGEWMCGASCGTSSVQHRTRLCNSPIALDGGEDCVGDRMEEKQEECDSGTVCTCADTKNSCAYWLGIGYCEPSSSYSSWMKKVCPETCGFCPNRDGGWAVVNSCVDGSTVRVCNNPAPMGNGAYCSGSNIEEC